MLATVKIKSGLPSSLELPSSNDTPVDNEDQNFIPNFLLFLLEDIWTERQDWFFGVDMGIYYNKKKPRPPIVPDAFLSLGVERRKPQGRLSYVFWEENDVIPILALEMVSDKYGGEYDKKLGIYTNIGVLYYLIYNPNHYKRHQRTPFEVYKLINGQHQRQWVEPYFMPEIGLGIGRSERVVRGINREVLYWYNALGERFESAEEKFAEAQEKLLGTERRLINTERKLVNTEGQVTNLREELSSAEKKLAHYQRIFGDLPEGLED